MKKNINHFPSSNFDKIDFSPHKIEIVNYKMKLDDWMAIIYLTLIKFIKIKKYFTIRIDLRIQIQNAKNVYSWIRGRYCIKMTREKRLNKFCIDCSEYNRLLEVNQLLKSRFRMTDYFPGSTCCKININFIFFSLLLPFYLLNCKLST